MASDLVRLAAEALYWKRAYDDSNPEVGFGPMITSQLDDIVKAAKITLTENEVREVVQRTKSMERR